MCGINGFITKNDTLSPVTRITSMNTVLGHRGPDDSGIHRSVIGDFIGMLGQVRLSIVDLSPRGHQPMFYSPKKGAFNECYNIQTEYDLVIVFNGEIYNHLAIKKDLEGLGYVFSTESDTEVILASYHAWGSDATSRWNGMWAICIYDKRNNTFFLSRDRFGKKPIYYSYSSSEFIFSSEIKGILQSIPSENIARDDNLSQDALDFYFSTGYIPAPLTIYNNISKLEAGTNLLVSIDEQGIHLTKHVYYELPELDPSCSREALIKEGRELLEDAVKIRMFSADVPVGAFLSGGLDSSSVVAEMTKYIKSDNLHTFSIGFEGKYDETYYIDIVKKYFGTNHHHRYFNKENFDEMLTQVAYHYDEPFADYSCFPTMLVSELARQNVTVALSGDGGDELFGGYMMHQIAAQMNLIYKLPIFIRKVLYVIIPKIGHNLSLFSRIKEAFRVSLLPLDHFYAEVSAQTVYKPIVFKEWTIQKLRKLLEVNRGNFVQSIIDFDLLYNTIPDNFLVKVDRASMAHALEVRSPFLDYRLVQFSRKIPVKWKVTWRNTKIIMRDIITGIVPNEIVYRDKKGFEPPIKDWILDEKYINIAREGLEDLYNRKVINVQWYNFYRETVFHQNNSIYNVYKIRLFLLIQWLSVWIPKESS